MKPGDLVLVRFPSWYHGIDHIDRLQGKIGIIMEVERFDNGTQIGHRRAHVLVECDVKQFDVKYLEPVDETG
jgi:hypothetical protein